MVALAVVMSWSLGTPAALAKTCAKLYKECQEVLKTSKADAATKEKAKKMCEEGIELHRNGKSAADHEKSVAIQKEALALLGVKK
jgi:hypothetical protein